MIRMTRKYVNTKRKQKLACITISLYTYVVVLPASNWRGGGVYVTYECFNAFICISAS